MTEREPRFVQQDPDRPKQPAHQGCHESSLKDDMLAEDSALQMVEQDCNGPQRRRFNPIWKGRPVEGRKQVGKRVGANYM